MLNLIPVDQMVRAYLWISARKTWLLASRLSRSLNGHWNWHDSIGFLWFPVNVPTIRPILYRTFPRQSEYRPKTANFSEPTFI